MADSEFHIACLRDGRLAPYATAALPAWLWTADASQVLWANATGAAIFGAPDPVTLARRAFDTGQPAAAQVARLAETLAPAAPPRLERLRGFGAGIGRALPCQCARLPLADGRDAILIVATEPAGPALTLQQRVARLLAGTGMAVAAFTPGGRMLHASRAATAVLGGAGSLRPLGADRLLADAAGSGRAEGRVQDHVVTLERLGTGADTVLLASFDASPAPAAIVAPEQPAAAAPVTPEPAAVAAADPAPATPEPATPEPETPQPATPAAHDAPAEQAATPQDAAIDSGAAADSAAPAVAADQSTAAPEMQELPPPIEGDADQPADEAADSPAPDTPPPAEPPVAHAEPPAPEPPVPEPPTVESPPVAPNGEPPERRHPLRFVWQMDADGQFSLGPGEFADLVGNGAQEPLSRMWSELAAELSLDPQGEVANAVASHDTWSGIEVAWPVDGSDERLPVELSGLPVFDRERRFGGYRGFGVCRDLDRVAALLRQRLPAEAPERTAAEAVVPTTAAVAESRYAGPPALQIVSPNVVPFRTPAETRSPSLSPVERRAFRELARKLTQRLKDSDHDPDAADAGDEAEAGHAATAADPPAPIATGPADEAAPVPAVRDARPLLDRLPLGVLVYRLESLLYANRAFLDWSGFADLEALAEAGGLDALFIDAGIGALTEGDTRSLTIATPHGDQRAVDARLFAVSWDDEPALVLMLTSGPSEAPKDHDAALRRAEAELRDLRAILGIAGDGVVMIGEDRTVRSADPRAADLIGSTVADLAGQRFVELFVPESRPALVAALDAVAGQGTARGLDAALESRDGRAIPVFVTLGRIRDDAATICAVLRDLGPWKQTEAELTEARRQAERTASARSDFLAKVSHEIRTPLNAIIGFSEVMMEERFGPLGNERYRDYLRDIHGSGGTLVALLDDLLDLSRIEAGKLDLSFGSLTLNELTQDCVAVMQPQANRERIIIRSSLTQNLPPIVADARSVRQIVLNLLSNSIKFTGAGGQVIVSTAMTDDGEVVLRVRDTGVGMTEQEIATALEPFRPAAGTDQPGGTGLGLPLTKALAEANRGRFAIRSAPNSGTLVEITFPAPRPPEPSTAA